MNDFRWSSAVDKASALRNGVITARELHDLTLGFIEKIDPLIHAVVAPLFDRPSAGIPMLLKDAGQEIAGTPHWVGVGALRDAAATSRVTTQLVRQFEAAGFSVVGKAACPQLSIGANTEPPGFEPTRNPWDLTRSPGGSSGGPAAAVAAGMVSVAHGSDATGSLRIPAALCGVATLNPTAMRIASVPPAGQPPNDVWRDFVIARHTEDLAFVFEMLTGSRTPDSVSPLRVGWLDHDPEFGLELHPACREGVGVAARLLEALGHHVEESWPDTLDHLWDGVFGAFSIVGDATRRPTLEWVEQRLKRPIREGELREPFMEAVARGRARSPAEVPVAQATLDNAVAPIAEWWNDHDILVTPTTFHPAWKLGVEAGPANTGTLLAPFSLSGQPALSLPLHQTDEGLPVGVQFVARRGSDEILLRLAQDLQTSAEWTTRRPPLA